MEIIFRENNKQKVAIADIMEHVYLYRKINFAIINQLCHKL